ncbi:ABC transporter ATP-binding protein [Pseudorhodoplanes sinuspersici]|uniref:ABC transporter ATP-binding protein n=1 Tax=Pseudorhodoplanes sinuspersici TaxID=1235591 RepID=A0A1W6ZLA8_9HYPH|nr:ABC transporter ATP-binding protein [Pseudorhodoplanes sinuspersici]ARP98213.1 ABC transporter ATP-binding protein [Pseudorhodoplanes sinuspersici]RKE68031.1 amino acid/amide ABC transporter ATP-binding protein 2 (HAAT family) [Pseudorhodoplanes sinuspersici]
MRDAALIETRDLHAFYGESHILHGVTFAVRPGECIGLMGRNGMGKSTLLRSLLAIVRQRWGAVRVRGIDMTNATPDAIARAGIAYVPEGRGIFGNLTVRENLVMAARPGFNGNRDWTFERVLETFPRLRERLDHSGTQLSGGEQQMLTIGRALMTNPDLLILDEATEGLAPLIAKGVWSILHEIRQHGIASIVVDRDYRSVCRLADRCIVLVKGKIALEGPGKELQADTTILSKYLSV